MQHFSFRRLCLLRLRLCNATALFVRAQWPLSHFPEQHLAPIACHLHATLTGLHFFVVVHLPFGTCHLFGAGPLRRPAARLVPRTLRPFAFVAHLAPFAANLYSSWPAGILPPHILALGLAERTLEDAPAQIPRLLPLGGGGGRPRGGSRSRAARSCTPRGTPSPPWSRPRNPWRRSWSGGG